MIHKTFIGGSLIVSEIEMGSVINRILIIRFEDTGVLSTVDFPPLRRISISSTERDITVILQSEALREYFDRFIEMFCDSISENHNSIQVLTLFIQSINGIKLLLELDVQISENVRKGLWGELTLLSKMLENGIDQKEIIDGWHGPDGAIHDFTCKSIILEVKTHSRSARVVNISNEYQLKPNGTKELNLVLLMAETIRGAGVDSLGEKYDHIIQMLQDEALKRKFREKCSNVGEGYAGPQSIFFDTKYNLLSISAFEVDHLNFPRLIDIPTGVSAVKYNVDISALDKFCNPNFEWKV